MALQLHVKTRSATGRKVRAHRRSGVLPGVVYGSKMEPSAIEMDPSEFLKIYRGAGTSALVDVTVDGGESFKALIQEVQPHLLHMHPVHVDLRKIDMTKEFEVDIPLEFVGEAPAVTNLSGTLIRNVDEVTVRCLPQNLPSALTVDISKLVTFEDSVLMKDIVVPDGVTVALDPQATIASVVPPITEDQLKKMEQEGAADISSVKVEGEEAKAEGGEEAPAEGGAKEEPSQS